MGEFHYVNGELFCEEFKVAGILDRAKTPFYLYSRKAFRERYRKLDESFSRVAHLICYSLKANSSIALLKEISDMGAGADIVSGGELFKAGVAGIPPGKTVYAGVGKTVEEIRYALDLGIYMFNVESIQELHLIDKIAGEMRKKARVAIRINPDVDAETHNYITTGKSENKFGLAFDDAEKVFKSRVALKNIDIKGLHIHIGSQITDIEPFVASLRKVLHFAKKQEIKITSLNVGGGLGITYSDEKPFTAQEFAKAVIPLVKKSGVKLILEPGRFIAGNAGILVTKVLHIKRTGRKTFVVVDAGMNDFLRPALYGAYHEIKPLRTDDSGEIEADIVGPVCETGDFLARGRKMPAVNPGDCLAVFGAGAYGFTMASNYNSRVRCAEFLVEGENAGLVRERETYEDLIRGETTVPGKTGMKFAKMCAAGNDFVAIDNRFGICTDGEAMARRLCKRSYSIGADGLLLIEESKKNNRLKMRIFNPDGTEAEMCGNGARCAAAFTRRKGITGRQVEFETEGGLVACEVLGVQNNGYSARNEVSVKMELPHSLKHHCLTLPLGGKKYSASFVNTGVPHTVFIVENADDVPVLEFGRQIRNHRMFQPEGTNVDFVEILTDSELRLRTYERGVEDETLACGTGAVAAAIICCLERNLKSPVKVKTEGGSELVVHLKNSSGRITEVFLQGDAVYVYDGKLLMGGQTNEQDEV